MSEPRYEVKIPNIMNPFTVEVNGKTYSFPAGTTQEVNRAVYDVIRNIESMVPTPNPRAGEPSFESLRDRPFGESTEVLFDQRVEIVSEERMIEGALPISAGDLVKVTWNGVEYECTAFTGANNLVFFGNTGFMGGEDNGIPFMMATGTFNGEGMFGIIAPDFIGQTVSVKVEGLVVKTIDPKFIPAGVGGGVVIVQNSAMASGIAVVDSDATATMNAAEIAEAIFAGKTVYFLEPNDGTLLPFVYGYRFGEMASGVMTLATAPEPYALFGAHDSDGYYHRIKVYSDGAYATDGFSVGK